MKNLLISVLGYLVISAFAVNDNFFAELVFGDRLAYDKLKRSVIQDCGNGINNGIHV